MKRGMVGLAVVAGVLSSGCVGGCASGGDDDDSASSSYTGSSSSGGGGTSSGGTGSSGGTSSGGAPSSWYSPGSSGLASSGGGSSAYGASSHATGGADAGMATTHSSSASPPQSSSGTEATDGGASVNECLREVTEPQVLYLSADDSNSQASPVIARRLIQDGAWVPYWAIRTWEFLNYYDISYAPGARNKVNVVAQMKPRAGAPGEVALQIGVQSHALSAETRRSAVVTLVLDSSGSMGETMPSGLTPMDLEKDVVRALAAVLRQGDIISSVEWDTSQQVRLDSHAVSGANDPEILGLATALTPGNATDLESGLRRGYELAVSNYRAGYLNRVILVSDGQANTGVTDEQLIATHADDAESEGIYLIGVGCGNGYNDTLMDTVTDKGKGAYVFIDSPQEARKMFVDRYFQDMELAVMDVRVQLTLPPGLRMHEFHGEQISTVPAEVKPQHLAPNDAMVFHQDLVSCASLSDQDVVRAKAQYTDPTTRLRTEETFEATVAELLAADAPQLVKGDAVVAYAEGLKDIYKALRAGLHTQAQSTCDSTRATVQDAAATTQDPELQEIAGLLQTYCGNLLSRHDVW